MMEGSSIKNIVTVDSKMFSIDYGDREMLLSHLDSITENDLLIFDMGYPGYWLFKLLKKKRHPSDSSLHFYGIF